MIKSFNDRAANRLFNRQRIKKFRNFEQKALIKLRLLDAAFSLNDLRSPPGIRLEKLSGRRKGQWSIRINDQYRICFKWDQGPYDVEITDYH